MIQALVAEYSVTSPGVSVDEILNRIGFVHSEPPSSGPSPFALFTSSGMSTLTSALTNVTASPGSNLN
jgi:hypothetical protein